MTYILFFFSQNHAKNFAKHLRHLVKPLENSAMAYIRVLSCNRENAVVYLVVFISGTVSDIETKLMVSIYYTYLNLIIFRSLDMISINYRYKY